MLTNGTMLELYADARLADVERLSRHNVELRDALVRHTTRSHSPSRDLKIVNGHKYAVREAR